jgi:hypothetical protein
MMEGMLEPHVVTLSSPRERDGHDYFVDRERGLCVFAVGRHEDDEDSRCGGAATALIDRVAAECRAGCGVEALRATLQAARAHINEGRIEVPGCEWPRASVAAILVDDQQLAILQAGGGVHVYRVRDGGVEVLRAPWEEGGGEEPAELVVRVEPLVDGDLFVLTCRAEDYREPVPPEVEALAREASVDYGRALLACFEALEERAALVVARWTAGR